MPEELNLPEAGSDADPLSIKPDPLSIEPDPLSIEPEAPPAGPAPVPIDDDEPITLVEESETGSAAEGLSKVRQQEMDRKKSHEVTLKRSMNLTGKGATRCRVFYCRFAVEAIEKALVVAISVNMTGLLAVLATSRGLPPGVHPLWWIVTD